MDPALIDASLRLVAREEATRRAQSALDEARAVEHVARLEVAAELERAHPIFAVRESWEYDPASLTIICDPGQERLAQAVQSRRSDLTPTVAAVDRRRRESEFGVKIEELVWRTLKGMTVVETRLVERDSGDAESLHTPICIPIPEGDFIRTLHALQKAGFLAVTECVHSSATDEYVREWRVHDC